MKQMATKTKSTTEKIVTELNKPTPATRAQIAAKVSCSVARVGEVVRACETVDGKLVYSSARNTELKTAKARARKADEAAAASKPTKRTRKAAATK
jgi:hypothetical protein